MTCRPSRRASWDRPGPPPLPRIAYAEPLFRAYANASRYRKYRPYVLAGVLVYMLARKIGGRT